MKSMDHRILLDFLKIAERLKCNTRHSWTSSGRHESVAEHTYRLCVFAWLVRKEFPECDMERVMQMSLFHDLGDAMTGDIPSFEKEHIHAGKGKCRISGKKRCGKYGSQAGGRASSCDRLGKRPK